MADGAFYVYLDGKIIKTIEKEKVSKELLAANPVKHMIFGLGMLLIGWNLAQNCFLLKLNNVPFDKLAKLPTSKQICRHSMRNNFIADKIRSVTNIPCAK